jgi:hypothetical protein
VRGIHDKVKVMDAEEVSKVLADGLELEGIIWGAGEKIREQSKTAYSQALLDARLLLFGACTLLLRSYSAVPGKTNQSISDRLTLIALALQGASATETMISEGQYTKAAAALKQDMEILVRIHETLAGVAQPGGTPQVKYFPAAGARRFYGELNDVAHPSNIDRLRQLLSIAEPAGGVTGVSPVPDFIPQLAVSLYQLHVYFLFGSSWELIKVMAEMYGADSEPIQKATRLVSYVGDLLESAGNFVREKSTG